MPKFIAIVSAHIPEAPEAVMTDNLYNINLPSARDLDWARVEDGMDLDLEDAINAINSANAPSETEQSNVEQSPPDNARSAIEWAVEAMTPGKAGDFLKLWSTGDFAAVKEKYPETPEDLLA